MSRAVKILLISLGSVILIGIIALMYIGANTPATHIYSENEIPVKYREELNKLSLLSGDEKIVFFYSDALLNITDGLYILTNEHVILYVAEWDEPKLKMNYSEIDFIDIDYDDSFLNDSFITIENEQGLMVKFPVSSEKGRDHDFFNYLQKKVELAH